MKFQGYISILILIAPLLLALAFRQGGQTSAPGLYIAVGDSIAAGVGSSLPRERGYPAILQRWMTSASDGNAPLVDLARPGETAETFATGGQLDEFRSEVALANDAGVPIAVVTVSLGGNEILAVADAGFSDRQEALTNFEQQLNTAITDLRATVGPDVPVVMTNYYDPTGGDAATQFTDSWWIAQFNAAISGVAEAHGCLVADVAGAFNGAIDEFTHYPADVHPTNRGYLAIARQVWTSLNFDNEAPVVEVHSPESTSRPTPTLQFSASDNVGLVEVLVYIGDETIIEPVETRDGRWVALLDLTNVNGERVEIGIVATDDAGNVTTVTHTIELAAN